MAEKGRKGAWVQDGEPRYKRALRSPERGASESTTRAALQAGPEAARVLLQDHCLAVDPREICQSRSRTPLTVAAGHCRYLKYVSSIRFKSEQVGRLSDRRLCVAKIAGKCAPGKLEPRCCGCCRRDSVA